MWRRSGSHSNKIMTGTSILFVHLNKHKDMYSTRYSNIVNANESKSKNGNMQDLVFKNDLDFFIKNQRFFQ